MLLAAAPLFSFSSANYYFFLFFVVILFHLRYPKGQILEQNFDRQQISGIKRVKEHNPQNVI